MATVGTAIERTKVSKHLTWEELHDYFHELLTSSRDSAVAAHLAACPSCAKKAHRVRLVLALLGGAAKPARETATDRTDVKTEMRARKSPGNKIPSSRTARKPSRASGAG
jgi:anti-sigma factor RsiW